MSDRAICTGFDIGKCICRRRQELGLTQEALAERIEVTCQQVQRYEYGKNRLNVESLQRIAKALDVPVEYFFRAQGTEEWASQGDGLNPEEQRMVELFRGINSEKVRETVVNVLKAVARQEN